MRGRASNVLPVKTALVNKAKLAREFSVCNGGVRARFKALGHLVHRRSGPDDGKRRVQALLSTHLQAALATLASCIRITSSFLPQPPTSSLLLAALSSLSSVIASHLATLCIDLKQFYKKDVTVFFYILGS
jgi:hypothetical protein